MSAKVPGAYRGHHITMAAEKVLLMLLWVDVLGFSFMVKKITLEAWMLVS